MNDLSPPTTEDEGNEATNAISPWGSLPMTEPAPNSLVSPERVKKWLPRIVGGAAAAILAVVVGGWAIQSWQKQEVLEQFEAAIVADDLATAADAVSEMEWLDSGDSRFIEARELLELLEVSREHFDAGQRLVSSGDYPAAFDEFIAVSERDFARYGLAQGAATDARERFTEDILEVAEGKLLDDPRQAFWDIENAGDFLLDTPEVRSTRDQAARAAISEADSEMRALVEAGNIVGAAKRWMLTSDALLEYSDEFASTTQWFDQRWTEEQSAAVEKVYSWSGGPEDLTRYFDRQAVRYRLSAGEITWITADAFELHIYEEGDSISLYLKAMLYHPRWVMADVVTATIDGVEWGAGFSADQIEQYEGTRNAWEGAWRPVTPADVDTLMDIALSTGTTIEFSGAEGTAEFALNSADKAGLQNMLLAYFALGGDPRSFW